MKSRIAIFFVILTICFSGCRADQKIRMIKTWNKDLAVVSEVSDETKLKQIGKIFVDRKLVRGVNPDFLYMIDITTTEESTRWRYSPDGYCTILSKAITPIYRLTGYLEFNRITKIEQIDSANAALLHGK